MGRRSAPMGSRYGRVCEELLEMGARVAVRSYGHCPQTGRMYYKPPSTTSATADGNQNGEEAASGEAGASATMMTAMRQQQAGARRQQQAAADKVEFHCSEFILYGGGQD